MNHEDKSKVAALRDELEADRAACVERLNQVVSDLMAIEIRAISIGINWQPEWEKRQQHVAGKSQQKLAASGLQTKKPKATPQTTKRPTRRPQIRREEEPDASSERRESMVDLIKRITTMLKSGSMSLAQITTAVGDPRAERVIWYLVPHEVVVDNTSDTPMFSLSRPAKKTDSEAKEKQHPLRTRGLTTREWILETLRHGPMTCAQIAKTSGVDRTAISNTLPNMEVYKEIYVDRTQKPLVYSLTEQGRNTAADAVVQLNKRQTILDALTRTPMTIPQVAATTGIKNAAAFVSDLVKDGKLLVDKRFPPFIYSARGANESVADAPTNGKSMHPASGGAQNPVGKVRGQILSALAGSSMSSISLVRHIGGGGRRQVVTSMISKLLKQGKIVADRTKKPWIYSLPPSPQNDQTIVIP